MLCKACGSSFARRAKGGVCPCCRTPLKYLKQYKVCVLESDVDFAKDLLKQFHINLERVKRVNSYPTDSVQESLQINCLLHMLHKTFLFCQKQEEKAEEYEYLKFLIGVFFIPKKGVWYRNKGFILSRTVFGISGKILESALTDHYKEFLSKYNRQEAGDVDDITRSPFM